MTSGNSGAYSLVPSSPALATGMRKIERKEWWLWSAAFVVTLLLTMGLISFVIPMLHQEEFDWGELAHSVRGLVGLVFLFDIYVVYQQLQIYRMRRQLLQREELFRLITENAADMITVVDGEGQLLYSSPSYQRILGYTPAEMQQTPAFDLIHPEDRAQVDEVMAQVRSTGTGRRIEYRARHKDGSWRLLEFSASMISDTQKNSGNMVIVNRDITDRRKLEEQFRQAQKMEAVGRLSGGIAHDFNNILGVIIGYGEILEEKVDQSNALAPCVAEILRAGRRAASLTRQLLAFSRQQVLEPKVVDLNAVVQDTEKMLRRLIGEDIELETVLDPNLGRVKADQGQLEQVILNLSVNARDAMPSGGKLTIKTENAELRQEDAQKYPYPVKLGQYILLTVTDTGVGMNANTQAHIFEPFFTTKEKGKGTGLGLATVYGICKQSDGYIWADSEVNVGTRFRIYLPQVDAEPAEVEKRSARRASALHGKETILLVEDEEALRTLTSNVLKQLGYTVLEAGQGKEACQISGGHKGVIDMLLTDVIMPGMNGRSLAEELVKQRGNIRVLYISGHTGQGVGQGVLPEGANFLAKPFTRENLARKVRDVLTGAQAAASGK